MIRDWIRELVLANLMRRRVVSYEQQTAEIRWIETFLIPVPTP
jgi:hypothetical protein